MQYVGRLIPAALVLGAKRVFGRAPACYNESKRPLHAETCHKATEPMDVAYGSGVLIWHNSATSRP